MKSFLKLGITGEVPDAEVFKVLKENPALTSCDIALNNYIEQITRNSEHYKHINIWPQAKERLESKWPSKIYNFLGTRVKCITAGKGVDKWIYSYFSAFETQSESFDYEIILAAVNGYTLLVSDNGVFRIRETISAIETTKAELLGFVADRLNNYMLLHSAGIVRKREGILLLGPGMSGKSTLAMSFYKKGCSIIGDDLIAIHKKTGELFYFPKSISLRQDTINDFMNVPSLRKLLKEARVPGVIDPRKINKIPLGPQKAKLIFVLQGFRDTTVIKKIRHAEAMENFFFRIVASPKKIAESTEGIKNLISNIEAYKLWQGSLDEVAKLILSFNQNNASRKL